MAARDTDVRPWPGPRPFRTGEWLYGRDRELAKLIRAVRQFRVITLHAASGVGKSSLLNAGLIPQLQGEGEVVVRCDFGFVGGGNTDEFYATVLRDGLRHVGVLPDRHDEHDPLLRDDPAAYTDAVLDDLLAPREADDGQEQPLPEPVLIFDQFEEVIRRDAELADRFLGKVIEIARRRPRVTQIVSLRSEYTYRLEPLRLGLGSAGWYSSIELGVLREAELPAVILEPAKRWCQAEGRPPIIDESAAEAILDDWRAAKRLQRDVRERKSSDPFAKETVQLVDELGGAEVGLLHLQALLDALFHAYPVSGASGPIDAEFVRAYRARVRETRPDDDAVAAVLLNSALRQYIERSLLPGRDERPWILAGVSEAVATVVENLVPLVIAHVGGSLSSGGYKTPLELREFILRAVGDTLGQLASQDVPADAGSVPFVDAACEAVRQLTVGEAGGNALLAVRLDHGEVEAVTGNGAASADGRLGLTGTRGQAAVVRSVAGPARRLGLTGTQVQAAVARATALGMSRLLDESILRKGSSVASQEIYELVHDGFGPALKAWAADQLSDISRLVSWPTPIIGETVTWAAEPLSDDLSYIRWIGCWVGSLTEQPLRAEGVVFDRCDFRGTVFERVEFIDCAFRDCYMNSVLFRDCFMDGAVFEWSTLEFSPTVDFDARERPYNMLSFDGVNAKGEAHGVAVTFRALRQMRNMSIENAHGHWRIERSEVSQVSLADGTADLDVDNSSLRQWWVSPTWKGTIQLHQSDVRFSLVSPDGYCTVKDGGGMVSYRNDFPEAALSRDPEARPPE